MTPTDNLEGAGDLVERYALFEATLTELQSICSDFGVKGGEKRTDGIRRVLTEVTAENARLREALEKIDAIRNSIIGFQTVGWSDHIYPMVAALEEAGFEGKGYDKMRTEIRTMLAAEAQLKAAREHIEQLSELLKIIKEHWIDYDQIYSISVHEADEFCAGLSQEAPK